MSLDGLLCHHGEDEVGHELDATCPLQVRPSGPGTYTRPQVSGRPHSAATGTCPVCGRTGVKVVAHVVRTLGPSGIAPTLASGKGAPLGKRPQLVEHKRPGRGSDACLAVAAIPSETTYRPSAELSRWVRDYGAEHTA